MFEESSHEQYKIGGRDACALMTGNWAGLYCRKMKITGSNSNNTQAHQKSIPSRIGMATELYIWKNNVIRCYLKLLDLGLSRLAI